MKSVKAVGKMGKISVLKNKNQDFIFVLLSNLSTVVVGIIMTLIVPKFLSIDQFGYFKVFTLYIGFVGFAHFGFNDGILMRYGNYDYEKLPYLMFRLYFRFLVFFQLIIGFLLIIIALYSVNKVHIEIILIAVCVNLIILNLNTFFQFIFQITKEFKIFSINTIIQNVTLLVSILCLGFFEIDSFVPIILAQTGSNLLLFVLYIIKGRNLIFGVASPFKHSINDIISNFQVGIYILAGNLMAVIVINIDKLFVERFFSIKEFAYYSFAVSFLTLIFTFVIAFSNYLYPFLSRVKEENLNEKYNFIYTITLIITSFLLGSYFLIVFIIQEFLNQYENAINLLLILYPSVIFRTVYSLLSTNFYKILKLQKDYNRNNLFALVIALLLNTIGILLKADIIYICVLNLFSFYIWSLLTDLYFKKKMNFGSLNYNLISILIIFLFFWCGTMKWYIGLAIYMSILFLISYLFIPYSYKKKIALLVLNLKSK